MDAKHFKYTGESCVLPPFGLLTKGAVIALTPALQSIATGKALKDCFQPVDEQQEADTSKGGSKREGRK